VRWRNPFGAAVFSFSGGPAAFFDEAVVGPAGQGEFGDVDRPVVFDPAVDVVHLAPVAGRGAAWPGAAAVLGPTVDGSLRPALRRVENIAPRAGRTAIALADHPLPVSATTAAELVTAGLDRDDLESVLRLIWPSMAELHACFQLSQRRQAARDDAVFNELIARLDEEDDDSDG